MDLQPLIVAHYRLRNGKERHRHNEGFVDAFKADPALLEQARGELEKLKQLDADLGGKLDQRCHDQAIRMATLQQMLSTFHEVMENERNSSARPKRRRAAKPAATAGKTAGRRTGRRTPTHGADG
jgi:hypothetical protein